MDINAFDVKIAEIEGKAEQLSIAQIKEVRRVINDLTGGKLHQIIEELPAETDTPPAE